MNTYDEHDYFEPTPEQRTLYQEGVCLPGWVGGLPEAPAQPLYMPAPKMAPSNDELPW